MVNVRFKIQLERCFTFRIFEFQPVPPLLTPGTSHSMHPSHHAHLILDYDVMLILPLVCMLVTLIRRIGFLRRGQFPLIIE